MSLRSTKPGLAAIAKVVQPDTFDADGLGENIATLGRAREEEDQYYRDQMSRPENMGGLNGAVLAQQQGGSLMQDPSMKVFLQALHEKNAAITPRSGFLGSHGTGPFQTETTDTYDPMTQESAVTDPNLQALQRTTGRAKRVNDAQRGVGK